MYFEQDWIMRQIEMLIQFVTRMIFHKDSISYKIVDETNLSQTDLLYKRLRNLIRERKICEAENMLFENIDADNKEYLALALDFYQTINQMTDDELEAHNFSKQEINDGIEDIMRKFHIPALKV